MKKITYTLISLFFFGCSACRNQEPIVDADFLNDLGIENYRIAAKLWLDVYNMDLSSMTYEDYIKYLIENPMPSAQGLVDKIKMADDKYFTTTDSTFTIVLLYKHDWKIVIDNSSSSFVEKIYNADSIETIKQFCSDFVTF